MRKKKEYDYRDNIDDCNDNDDIPEAELECDNRLWWDEFPERGRPPRYRATIPFLDNFRFILIVFKETGSFHLDDTNVADYSEGKARIRLERIGVIDRSKSEIRVNDRAIRKSDKNQSSKSNKKLKDRSSNNQPIHKTMYEKDQKNQDLGRRRVTHINIDIRSSHSILKRSNVGKEPIAIFNFWRKFLQEIAAAGKGFPKILRDWESDSFEKDPTPSYKKVIKPRTNTSEDISYFNSYDPVQNEDPLLPTILTFVAAFEPEYMESYFNYMNGMIPKKMSGETQEENIGGDPVQPCLNSQISSKNTKSQPFEKSNTPKKISIEKGINPAIEFRWFVRNYNRTLAEIEQVNPDFDLGISSWSPKNPYIKLLIEKARVLNVGYNEFCKRVVNLGYSLAFYRKLFDDANEEDWHSKKYHNRLPEVYRNYDRLPLHLLKNHPEFSHLATIWDISADDLNKLIALCDVLQMPIDDLSHQQHISQKDGFISWYDIKGFFCFGRSISRIVVLCVFSPKVKKVRDIIQKFPDLTLCYFNWKNIMEDAEEEFKKSSDYFVI